jgi:hypothetical protein
MDTQNEPIEEGSDDASRAQKIDGVVEQVRGDLGLGHVDDVRVMVRQRLEDAGLPSSDEDVEAVVSAAGA